METVETTEAPRVGKYDKVNALWPDEIPGITREEAQRASNKLYRTFGFPPKPGHNVRVRRVWVRTKTPTSLLSRGWRRLVHDISHGLYRAKYQTTLGKTHHPLGHDGFELEIARYVIEHGWLDGKLKPKIKPKAKPSIDVKVSRLDSRIKSWESKLRRAENALRKLKRQKTYYSKKLS